jgi:HEAT repeat protein
VNDLLKGLSGGDIRSDGMADEVADEVIRYPHLYDLLIEGLLEPEDVLRGRTAHALERISRSHPEMVSDDLPLLIDRVTQDTLPMVKWHIAMILGNLALYDEKQEILYDTLLQLLDDPSTFVKSWAIVSLCIFGRLYPETRQESHRRIAVYQNDDSIAIRSKVSKALAILESDNKPLPKGWVKSAQLTDL